MHLHIQKSKAKNKNTITKTKTDNKTLLRQEMRRFVSYLLLSSYLTFNLQQNSNFKSPLIMLCFVFAQREKPEVGNEKWEMGNV